MICYAVKSGARARKTANERTNAQGWTNHGLQRESNFFAGNIMAPQWSRSSSRDTRVSTHWVETDRELGRKADLKGCHNQAQNAAEQG